MLFRDNVGVAVAVGGTSSITLGAALPGRQALQAGDDGKRGVFFVKQGSDWQTVRALYTHSGTTLSGLDRIDGSSGALLTITTAAEVYLVWSSHESGLAASFAALTVFGDGSDGDVTVSTTVALTRDMHYRNLTLAAGGKLVIGDANPVVRIFVSGTLDLSAADVGAISANGKDGTKGGNSTTNTTPGVSRSGASGATELTAGAGKSGGNSGTGGGTASGTAGSAGTSATHGFGGDGGDGGRGAQGWNVQQANGAGGVVTNKHAPRQLLTLPRLLGQNISGGAGGGGGSGGGANAYAGSGGGSGGAGGNVLILCARKIKTSGTTPAGVITAKGGRGGDGGDSAYNGSRGEGGGGGGGGAILLVVLQREGATVANGLDAGGGNGGSLGTWTTYEGTGDNPVASKGAQGGVIAVFRLDLGTTTLTQQSTAPSGRTGGITRTAL